MDNNNFDDLLKASKIFSSLDENSRKLILPYFSRVDLTSNEILFYQGDPSDNVYLVLSGKLSAHLTEGVGKIKVVGHIEPGETVGELGAISGDVRSLTIKALKDSALLKISAQDFQTIVHQHPAVMFSIVNPIISRSISLIQVLEKGKRDKHIVIVPANHSTSLKMFSEKLHRVGEKYGSTLIVSDYHPDFIDKDISTNTVRDKIRKQMEAKKYNHRIIYILSSFDTPLARAAFKRMDVIYVVANADAEPAIDDRIFKKIESKDFHLNPRLILLHPEGSASIKNTSSWLKLASFTLYHHVRMDVDNDVLRLFRFLRGKAVGLVLSGGGTRGWAHIGAIKALHEAGIPIDIIGGTSVGAIVAGIYAMNQSRQELYEKFFQLIVNSKNSVTWHSLTWPVISLFNAEKYTRAQMEVFQQTMIEDLEIPFFCITSNLTTKKEEAHRSGLLWEKVRASTSIPGLVPPMIIDGDLHFDGGLLNNMPVDAMRELIGERGKIIAIELSDRVPEKDKYRFPPILKFKDILLGKLGIKKNDYLYPPLFDTFLKSLFLGSLLRSRQNALMANIYVSLNVANFKMLQSNPEEGDKLIQLGYEETIKQIQKLKNKNILPG